MHKSITKVGIVALLFILGACTGLIDREYWDNTDVNGNKIDVSIQEYKDQPGKYLVTSSNPKEEWSGTLAGGNEKIQARQTALKKTALAKVTLFCGTGGYILNEDDELYSSSDESSAGLDQDVLDSLVVDVFSNDTDGPLSYQITFMCK